MMNKTRLFLLVFVLMLALAGCRESAQPTAESGLQIDLHMDPSMPALSGNILVIGVTDASGSAVTDATVSVRGDMNHAGMVPVEAEATANEAGEYRIPFNWTMGGGWVLTVTVTRPDGTTARQTFEVTVESETGEGDMNTPQSTTEAGS